VPGTNVPWTLFVFLFLAVVTVAIVHGTWIGRQVFAVGKNKEAARYSGVRVGALKMALFAVSGLVAALAGILLTSRTSAATPDAGLNFTLAVVTIVVLGGVDINGGKGTVPGVILAVLILGTLKSALTEAGISTDYQNVAIGLLLIISVVTPNLLAWCGNWSIALVSDEGGRLTTRRPARSFVSAGREEWFDPKRPLSRSVFHNVQRRSSMFHACRERPLVWPSHSY